MQYDIVQYATTYEEQGSNILLASYIHEDHRSMQTPAKGDRSGSVLSNVALCAMIC